MALVDAVDKIYGHAGPFPVRDFLAAISVGLDHDGPITDLCFAEDREAVVDMNVVRTGQGQYVEVQGTGEHGTFDRSQLNALLDMADQAIDRLIEVEKEALGPLAKKVGFVYETRDCKR